MKAVSLGKQKKKSLPWRIVSGLANTALLIILALFVYLFLAFPMQMKGHSMEPAAADCKEYNKIVTNTNENLLYLQQTQIKQPYKLHFCNL